MPGVSKRKSSELSLKRLIDDIVVNDEAWHCLVTMLIETRQSQMSYMLMLNEACENGYRKAVQVINRQKLLAKLRSPLIGQSSYTVQQNPDLQKIRQSIQTSLEKYNGDSCEKHGLAEATLIKWMIYEVRLEWLARSAAEREEPQPKSQLRRRGEEWRDRVYVDDAPENGPDLYILLTGFHDPNLPLELIETRVPLSCILRLDDFHFNDEHTKSSLSNFEVENDKRSYCQANDEDYPIAFWLEYDKSQCSEVAIRSFCPPSNLCDLYDRISYVLYEVHELVQAHASYLCAMKVIHVYESSPKKQIASVYETHLKAVPDERTTVDIIMDAMLRQVEKSFQLEDNFFSGVSEQTYEEESSRQTSLSGVNSAAFARLTEKLRLLNLKYELISDQPELILRGTGGGDLLSVCRANDEACNLKDLPTIAEAWRRQDLTEAEACKLHLPGIYECSKKEGINRDRAAHLLNLLGLRKMFNSYLNHQKSPKLNDSNSVKDNYYLITLDDKTERDYKNEKYANLNNRCEVENNSNKLTTTRSIFENFSFETKQVYEVQQYNNISSEKFETLRSNGNGSSESSLNFDCNLKKSNRYSDTVNSGREVKTEEKSNNDSSSSNSSTSSTTKPHSRETLLDTPQSAAKLTRSLVTTTSGCRCVEPRPARSTKLSEVQRLSSLEATSLLRSFESCSSLFGLIDARESLGLETSSSHVGGYPRLDFAELLPSPPILRDCFHSYMFSNVQYFAPTDSLLLLFYDQRPGQVAERRVTCALRTPLCLRDFCEYVVDEECDWLQRRKSSLSEKHQGQIEIEKAKEVVFKDEDFLLPDSLKASQLAKLKKEEIPSVGDKELAAEKDPRTKPSSSSSSSSQKNNGAKVDPTFDFIAYDLGIGRVQVTNLASSYEASDGTRLRLTRDTWLRDYGKEMTTSLEIQVPDCCTLRYHEISLDERLFHLTTKNGIIVAFQRKPYVSDTMNRTNELMYDIQMSWPSGLIVKPVEYPDADYPFYVLQYYSSKEFRCESIKNESHRKYLHNGDVVKFFNDSSIVVLRPNGIVITVERSEGDDGKSLSSWEKSYSSTNDNIGLSRETSFLLQQYSSEWTETTDLRYSVLELDGRHYEVDAEGHIVRELDRLRASLAEEYCAEEKFARRADGTDALFTSDAELIVSFPDGTRTLSRCVIEDMEYEDGFIVVSVHNRAEHPKYATVAGHHLSMCHQNDKLELQLDDLKLECGKEIELELGISNVSISRQCKCSATSQASFDLTSGEKQLARLHDKASRLLLTVWREDARFELTPEICQTEKRDNDHDDEDDEEEVVRCRTFAVSRDALAREYLHRSMWQRHFVQEMLEDKEASLISCDDDGIASWLSLLPREEWTMEYQIRKAKPSVVDEEDELPFKAATRQRFLRARLVEGIGNANDENSLISMQRALLRYWRQVATGRGKAVETGRAITCECRGEIESWMRDVVLGRVGTIDPQSYEAGRQELERMRIQEDEERTRQMIDLSYTRDAVPETNVLGGDNE